MDTECYWNYPLKGEDGCTENGSRKYREYYFEKDGECTCKEIADHFGVAEQTIKNHKKNYGWKDALNDKRAYIQKKRLERRERNLDEFKDKDYKNANAVLSGRYKLLTLSYIVLRINENEDNLTIPEWLTEKVALKIVMDEKTFRTHNQILTDLDYLAPKDDMTNINNDLEDLIDPEKESMIFEGVEYD